VPEYVIIQRENEAKLAAMIKERDAALAAVQELKDSRAKSEANHAYASLQRSWGFTAADDTADSDDDDGGFRYNGPEVNMVTSNWREKSNAQTTPQGPRLEAIPNRFSPSPFAPRTQSAGWKPNIVAESVPAVRSVPATFVATSSALNARIAAALSANKNSVAVDIEEEKEEVQKIMVQPDHSKKTVVEQRPKVGASRVTQKQRDRASSDPTAAVIATVPVATPLPVVMNTLTTRQRDYDVIKPKGVGGKKAEAHICQLSVLNGGGAHWAEELDREVNWLGNPKFFEERHLYFG
jgi:hypothetical protein